ncbi:hypothetical protein FSW04_14995 [Baekduia soli]|uniref:Flippase-like domain-containing protein n=1 Tax=Baekduia soli TaxID=496014 RepID=A0A5B8U6X7_9ACTN|nr:lysylphosphatidylglycerol synthase domain-containing protein [Baekduia soli]QEC48750.1 hypothetical protein FSW04_14995 [Baekduia soli]
MARSTAPIDARVTSHRLPLTVVALALAGAGGLLVATWAGWSATVAAFGHLHPGWIAVIVGLAVAGLGGYTLAYGAWARAAGNARPGWSEVARVVTAGFGPFAFLGGFALDRRALCELGEEEGRARRLVLGLGALEYAVLAPAAWVAAILLLAAGSRHVQTALLWPWVAAVPAGFAIGFWAAARWRRRTRPPGHRLTAMLDDGFKGFELLRDALRHPIRHAGSWLGMAMYWAAEIGMLVAAARLFGTTLGAAHAVLAYATGYSLTRRSMPLAGAGATEISLAFALLWVGLPLATALPIVVAYRAANLLLPALPALRHARRPRWWPAMGPRPVAARRLTRR